MATPESFSSPERTQVPFEVYEQLDERFDTPENPHSKILSQTYGGSTFTKLLMTGEQAQYVTDTDLPAVIEATRYSGDGEDTWFDVQIYQSVPGQAERLASRYTLRGREQDRWTGLSKGAMRPLLGTYESLIVEVMYTLRSATDEELDRILESRRAHRNDPVVAAAQDDFENVDETDVALFRRLAETI